MTSRVLFYKEMIEDLRRKIWMLALSGLASFMALPVFFLLMSRDWNRRISNWYPEANWSVAEYKLSQLQDFFGQEMTITCGIVLVVGAVIVGLFSFRHVFSKRMVDLYHSIPITRKQLFLVQYLNGFLIWFVPMFVGVLICAVMALVFLGDTMAWIRIIGIAAATIANLVLAFLIIYHMVMVAVMISGNILNTLVSGTIISFSVLALYGMFHGFASTYFETYYSFVEDTIQNIFWAAPPVGAVYQLVMYGNTFWNQSMQTFPVVMNILVMLLLFVVAFAAYLKRPSELAEQGIKIKPMRILFKTLVTLLAGMVGWILFGYITDVDSVGWTVFGAVLAGVLTYGVLDIIFFMDFKAFFKNKIQMAVTVAGSIVVCCLFSFDMLGYDTYLPDQENIAEMGIWVNGYTLRGSFDNLDEQYTTKNRIKNMKYTDTDVIYAFLKQMSEKQSDTYLQDADVYYEGNTAGAYVRVQEKSGKTYYRHYIVSEAEEELLVPILRDTSYVTSNMLAPTEILAEIDLDEYEGEIGLESWNSYVALHGKEGEEFAAKMIEAYNTDLLENPDIYIYREQELLGKCTIRQYGSKYMYMRLGLYESMEHVMAVLEAYGYADMFLDNHAEDITKLEIEAYLYDTNNLKTFFGLDEAVETEKQSSSDRETVITEDVEKGIVITSEYSDDSVYLYRAVLDDKAEIAELMDLISLYGSDGDVLFGPEYVYDCSITIYTPEMETYGANIRKGVLPEKYLDYFVRIDE